MEAIRNFISSVPNSETVSIPSYVVARRFEYANAAKNCSFTDAFIAMEKIDVNDGHVIYLSELFKPGLEILKKYQDSGNGDDLSEDAKKALECLVNFFNFKDRHLKCLVKCMEKQNKDMEEAEVSFVLAEHIFGPLIPGEKYILDQHCSNSLKECPGGCGKGMEKRNASHTGIGNSEVWHGFVDIWLEKGISVAVFEQSSDDDDDDDDYNDDDDDNDGNEDDEGYGVCEPSPKQRKYSRGCSIPVEVKKKGLKAEKTIMQTAAQTIVNGYLHSKQTSFLIPSFSACLDACMIFMYHPKSDLFLMSPAPFVLLDTGEKNIYSDCQIIYLWMILNYEVCSQRFDKSVESLKSGFHKFAKNKLSFYSEQLAKGQKSFERNPTSEIKEVNVRKNILSM